MEGILPPSQAHMADIKAGFESSGFKVNIGG
jgi:hypothetical protein